MALRAEDFTDATAQLYNAAQDLCINTGNPQIEPVHLAVSLFDNPDSLAVRVAEKAQADTTVITRGLRRMLVKRPTMDPPPDSVAPSAELRKLLIRAQKRQKDNKESHTAIDHVLYALADDKGVMEVSAAPPQGQ